MGSDKKAIDLRCSRRAYDAKPLGQQISSQLKENIRRYNIQSELHIQLIEDDPQVFAGFKASYGIFSGVRHYFALVGSKGDDCLNEKAGYWGERLVLDATLLGLGTCWVGGTYSKDACKSKLSLLPSEELVCVIAVGEAPPRKTVKEKMLHRLAKRGTKPIDELYTIKGDAPDSFKEGMRAVQKAPSALNKQPVHFIYSDDVVTAIVPDKSSYQGIDLGIAMLHFEIGSGTNNRFEPRNGENHLILL